MSVVFRILVTLLHAVTVVATGQTYLISTVAGGGPPLGPLPALDVPVGRVTGVATDHTGNVYFSSSFNFVFKLDPNGILTRFAGNGSAGFSGDGGLASSAELNFPQGLAVDDLGDLYIADSANGRIRKVTKGGVITTVAGDCCVSASTVLSWPQAVAVDSTGALYIAEAYGVLKASPSGRVTTVLNFGFATGLAVDSTGNLFVAVAGTFQVSKISPDGITTKIAGNGQFGYSGDGGPALSAPLGYLSGLALDSAGNVIIADGSIRKISTDGIIHKIADTTCCTAGDGSLIDGPAGSVAVDSAGNIYVAVYIASVLRRVTSAGTVTNVAGTSSASYVGDGGPALDAQLSTPEAVAVDTAGNLYIADYANSRVRKVSPQGTISTVAGNGISGFSGDGGPATSAQISGPVGVATDSAGNLFISEYLNNRIRKVAPDGIITTVAGTGGCCAVGDGGPAVDAVLAAPHGIALDSRGNLYIADSLYSRIRKVTPNGVITTLAGTGVRGFSGDGGPSEQAQLNYPWGVAVDASGNVFVADEQNGRVRKISSDGVITTVAGGPTSNFLISPGGVAVDSAGDLFISGRGIWRLSPRGLISSLSAFSSTGEEAQIGGSGLAIDSRGDIFIVTGNTVQMLQPRRGHPRRPSSGAGIFIEP